MCCSCQRSGSASWTPYLQRIHEQYRVNWRSTALAPDCLLDPDICICLRQLKQIIRGRVEMMAVCLFTLCKLHDQNSEDLWVNLGIPRQLKLSPGKDFSWKGLTVVQTTVCYQDHSETNVKVVEVLSRYCIFLPLLKDVFG